MASFSAAVQWRRRCGPSRTSILGEEPVIGLTLLLSLSEVGDRVRSIQGLLHSKTVVEGIAPDVEDIVIWDAALPGFGVRVKPTGVRSYIVQYRSRETGASKRMTIGQHGPLLTFEQARRQARALLADAM